MARSVSGSWPDDGRIGDAAVGELHPDRVGAGNDVLVGDDGALRIDDDARAQTALDALPVARPVIPEQLIERRGLPALGDHARRIDVDHRRRCACHRVGEALHRRTAAARAARVRAAVRRGRGADGAEQGRFPPDDQEGGCKADHDRSQQKTREDACLLQSHSLCWRKAAFVSVYNAPPIFFAKHCRDRGFREDLSTIALRMRQENPLRRLK